MSLDILARLADIRLRVYNRERIDPADMRHLLDDITQDRDNSKRVAAKQRREVKKAASAVKLDIDELFGGSKGGSK